MNTLTDLEKFVVTQLFAGENSLTIVRKICESGNGVPGADSEGRYFAKIAEMRQRIKDFEGQVFELAVLGFEAGHPWKFVFDTIHSSGLIHSFELTPILVRARDFVFPPKVEVVDVSEAKAANDSLGAWAIAESLRRGDPVLEKMIAETERVKREHAEHEAARAAERGKY